MRVVRNRQAATAQDTPAAVALGFFDGVHRGHAAVVGAARQYAQEHGLRLAVFTFGQGPKGDELGRQLQNESEKHHQLAALGVETCYQPSFESFCSLSPRDFFARMLLEEYNAKALFCGEDFGFGAKREGDVSLLDSLCHEAGIALQVVPTTLYKGKAVSSSRIRQALSTGDIPEVNAMLGRPYEIDFPVGHGKKLGTKLGMPTINQKFPPGVQPPPYGVYITRTVVGDALWPSATGFGTRPSVDGGEPTCETFLPGFSGDLYGKHIRVQFFEKIADSEKFESLDQLAASVQQWGQAAVDYFARDHA